jgi:hypothetical protein
MASHQGRLYHCGAVARKRSTFADANRARDFRVLSGLFEAMLAGASRGFRRKMGEAVRLIDSTGAVVSGERRGRQRAQDHDRRTGPQVARRTVAICHQWRCSAGCGPAPGVIAARSVGSAHGRLRHPQFLRRRNRRGATDQSAQNLELAKGQLSIP